jgi:DNA replication protein DnaC
MVNESLLTVFRKLCRGELEWPLVLNGPTGSGKTCASLALVDHVPSGEFLTEAQLYEHLNARRDGGGLQDLWRQITKADLFVLDEFKVRANPTAFQFESILRFLETRTARPTIITMNTGFDTSGKLLTDIARVYDDRIASRLSAGTIFFLKGDDLRLKPKLPR